VSPLAPYAARGDSPSRAGIDSSARDGTWGLAGFMIDRGVCVLLFAWGGGESGGHVLRRAEGAEKKEFYEQFWRVNSVLEY